MMERWEYTLVLLSVFAITSAKIHLEKGRYEQFSSFCSGDQIYVGLPIDCTGYLHCQKAMGMTNAFWQNCPADLYFNLEKKACNWPENASKPCPDIQESIEKYCPTHPDVILPNPDHCAQYFDCSRRNGLPNGPPYLSECPHPQLFSFESLKCEDFDHVNCKDRFEPHSPCHYLRHQCSGPGCIPCEELIPGCEGSQDGPNPYPGRVLTKFYLICLNNKTSKVKTCERGLFDPVQMTCTVDTIDKRALDKYCEQNRNERIEHPGYCSRYYDCEGRLTGDYERECMYPQLYSPSKKLCMEFDKVDCGRRLELKNKCEYMKFQCVGENCPICEMIYPSCMGLSNGDNAFLGKENTPKYIVCKNDRLMDIRTCPREYNFEPMSRQCLGGNFSPAPLYPVADPVDPTTGLVETSAGQFREPEPIGTISSSGDPNAPPDIIIPSEPQPATPAQPTFVETVRNPQPQPDISAGLPRICDGKLNQLIPDPTNCARYYNCSMYAKTISGLPNNVGECPYPQLFSVKASQCDDFTIINCGSRYEPKAPCEYVGTEVNCAGPMCQLPCEERSPKCTGQRNGNNTFVGRELSPFYITCHKERTLSVGICRYGVYDPVLRYCTTELDRLSVELFCAERPTTVFPHIANCAKYYDCTAKEKDPIFGKFLRECEYPRLFNIERLRCVHRNDAKCRWRYEPTDPCEWKRNDYCADPNSCVECAVRYRGCLTKPDGLHAVPNNNFQYLDCFNGAVRKIGSCQNTPFDPLLGRCSPPAYNCVGLPNGMNAIAGNEVEYIICDKDKFAGKDTCSPGYFDSHASICRPSAVESNCDGRTGLFLMTGSMSDYYVCQAGLFVVSDTCAPGTFNVDKQICEYSNANSSPYPIPIPHDFKCAYSTEVTKQGFPLSAEHFALCRYGVVRRTDTCRPGVFDFTINDCFTKPCFGKANGKHVVNGNDRFYLVCYSGDIIAVSQCYKGIYDPVQETCVRRTLPFPTDPEAFCSKNPTAVIAHPEGCARYIDCRTRESKYGPFSHECPYPDLFDTYNSSCKPYRVVKCGTRPEPKAPCDYMEKYICTKDKSCVACEVEHPTCVGKRDGPQAIPNKPKSFVLCQDERTKSITNCPATASHFDPNTGKCSVNFDPLNPVPYCTENPTAVIPHPNNCAQYIDCRQRNTLLGNFLQECTYPLLVNAEDTSGFPCQPFANVNCGTRPEPKAHCDYELIQRVCPDPQKCPPCEARHPSCANLADGNHRFPGNPRKFIICIQGRNIRVENCQNGIFDENRGACILEFDYKNPKLYCDTNPRALVEDTANCARYFNCSAATSKYGPYVEWCTFPLLYSSRLQQCIQFTDVDCGQKYIPIDTCDYPEMQCPLDATNCIPCAERFPSCRRLSDGDHPFPGREGSEEYITCKGQRTVFVGKCMTGIFNPTTRTCVSMEIDPANPQIYCDVNPTAVVAHPQNCEKYFDCTKPAGQYSPYMFECQYPALFSRKQGRCMRFIDVECGQRNEPHDPCDYLQNQCTGPNCLPCRDRLPSCVGRRNGNNTFPGRELTENYIVCWENRTVGVEKCPIGYFDPGRGRCRRTIRAAVIRSFCTANPGAIRENPVNCAQYFDCGEESIRERTFLRECPYPMLFSSRTQTCKNYTEVDCGQRQEYFTPCAYLQNRCNPRNITCTPCIKRNASCEGLPDGLNPLPELSMTQEHMICHRQRTIGNTRCPGRSLFDPGSRRCVTEVTEEMIKRFCSYNPTSILEHPFQCAQYFDCRQAIRGSYLRECKYPQLFHARFQTCRNFTDVTCGYKFVPQAPCDYLQNHCGLNATDCTPCEDRLPSCVGLPDDNNPFPGRTNSEYYIKCFRNRTVSVEACQVSRFDNTMRDCSTKIDQGLLRRHCRADPNSIIADPENCARYYRCNDASTVPGLTKEYQRECKYPKLFASASVGCQLFMMVNCSKRYVPKSPCDYVENQCFEPGCQPCQERIPGCIGKKDGSNEFPGKQGSEFYIVCYQERTVAIVNCTVGVYNHQDRACVGQIQNPITTTIVP